MRFGILGLFIFSATWSFGQTPRDASFWDLQSGQSVGSARDWKGQAQARSDLSRLPPGWHMDLNSPLTLPFVQRTAPTPWSANPGVDAKMIVHPPPGNIGKLLPGAAVDRKEFDNLRILPIDRAEARLEEIPTRWPNGKVEAIPVQWSGFRLTPIEETPVRETLNSPPLHRDQ